jgi:hypothetical protein
MAADNTGREYMIRRPSGFKVDNPKGGEPVMALDVHCTGCGAYLFYSPKVPHSSAYCDVMCSRNPPLTAKEVRDSRIIAVLCETNMTLTRVGELLGYSRATGSEISKRRLTKVTKDDK